MATKGRGFGTFDKDRRIVNITDAKVGDVLLEHSKQFDADNTIRVTREFEGRVWACFVNPENPQEVWGAEFCIWYFDLENTVELWRAVHRRYSIFRHTNPAKGPREKVVVETGLTWEDAKQKEAALNAAESAAKPLLTSWTIDLFIVQLENTGG